MTNEEQIALLKEILKWLKLQGMEVLKNKIAKDNLLANGKEITIYHHSDGTKSSREIAKIVNTSHVKIQRLWRDWHKAGIVEPTEKYRGGRYKKLFELTEMGKKLP